MSRIDIVPSAGPRAGDVSDNTTTEATPPTTDSIIALLDAPAPAGKSTDGRHARSERSREAMVDALLELLREGGPRPSSAQIAERAGVTQRTLFNQFGDMDSLISAVAVRQSQRFVELLPDAGDGTLEERVTNYCAGLSVLLEDTMHVRWAVVTNPNPSWDGDSIIRLATEYMRKLMARSFETELDVLPDDVGTQVLDALDVVTDPVTWRLHRVQRGFSAEASRAILERTMLALWRDALASA